MVLFWLTCSPTSKKKGRRECVRERGRRIGTYANDCYGTSPPPRSYCGSNGPCAGHYTNISAILRQQPSNKPWSTYNAMQVVPNPHTPITATVSLLSCHPSTIANVLFTNIIIQPNGPLLNPQPAYLGAWDAIAECFLIFVSEISTMQASGGWYSIRAHSNSHPAPAVERPSTDDARPAPCGRREPPHILEHPTQC